MKRTKKSATTPVAPEAHAVAESRPAPIVRRDEEFFRLRVGDVVALDGTEYVVDYVNASRARCVPLSRKQVEYKTVAGKEVKFETDHTGKNISPNSECSIIRRLGVDWRASRC